MRAFPMAHGKRQPWPNASVELFERLLAEHDPVISVIACNTARRRAVQTARGLSRPAVRRHRAGHQAGGGANPVGRGGGARHARHRQAAIHARTHPRLGPEMPRPPGRQRPPGAARRKTYNARRVLSTRKPVRTEIETLFRGNRTATAPTSWCWPARTTRSGVVNRMRKTAPWPVDWIDPAEAIARRALSLLAPDDDAPSASVLTAPSSPPASRPSRRPGCCRVSA